MEKQEKYCFGTSEERCGTDTFDSIEELISFADRCYKDADGNYWDEDADDYPEVIYIGIAHEIKAKDYAPTLEEISDEMTDAFYSKWNVDEDERVRFYKEAQEEWERFVEKNFEMPFDITSTWIGMYNIKEHRWIDRIWREEK